MFIVWLQKLLALFSEVRIFFIRFYLYVDSELFKLKTQISLSRKSAFVYCRVFSFYFNTSFIVTLSGPDVVALVHASVAVDGCQSSCVQLSFASVGHYCRGRDRRIAIGGVFQ